MLGLSPSDFVLRALSNVQMSDLEQTLLVCKNFTVFYGSLVFQISYAYLK